jgi:hypothetical protein
VDWTAVENQQSNIQTTTSKIRRRKEEKNRKEKRGIK